VLYLREDQADIRVQVDGVNYGDGNSWVTYAGAGLSAAGVKTRPGGMGREIELGGPATRADCTITTQNSDIMAGQHPTLEAKIGRGTGRVSVQYLDDYGAAIPGARFTIQGKLKEATLPGQNGENSAVGMYTIIVACDELAA